jgi:hypothetical protein
MLHPLASETGQIGTMNRDIFRVDTGTSLAQTYILVCMKGVCVSRAPNEILESSKRSYVCLT